MEVKCVTLQGSNAWNEDALVIHEDRGIYGVLDGATSLVPYSGENGETGGYLASRLVAGALLRMSAAGELSGPSLQDMLLDANRELREEMARRGIDPNRKDELWGTGAAIVRIGDDHIEYAQAGDCMIAALYGDGTIRIVTRDQLAIIDQETKDQWADGIGRGMRTREELWEYVKPQIVAGRKLTNTPNGYAVLNGEPELAKYLEFGRINRIQLQALFLMTDGLYYPMPAGVPAFDAMHTTAKVKEMGLAPYIEWLSGEEDADPDCLRYPRVKKSDDKTAIWIEFMNEGGVWR